ncbi:hypothetical protein [Dactylosporangium sp. CS-033363]|uniref:hypothetical protein n=1 Tax=Dactylosporangium sp. CS-033363 TaxID=3239935 RepID=UPI003D8E655E
MSQQEFALLERGELSFLFRPNHEWIQPGDLLEIRQLGSTLFNDPPGRALYRVAGTIVSGQLTAPSLFAVFRSKVVTVDLGDRAAVSLKPAPGHNYPGMDAPDNIAEPIRTTQAPATAPADDDETGSETTADLGKLAATDTDTDTDDAGAGERVLEPAAA